MNSEIKRTAQREAKPVQARRGPDMTRRGFLGAAALSALSLAGCGQNNSTSSELSQIRIGYFQSPNGELLAKGEELVKKAYPDVEISYVQFDVGRDVNTAMSGGSLDLATIGTPPGTTGIVNQLPYKVYYLHDIIGTSEALVARSDAGISAVTDLKGKRVATAFGSTSHFSLLAALQDAGVSEDDVTLLDMSAPDTVAAWGRGELDAAYMWQPAQEQLVEAGGTVIITSQQLADKGHITGEFGIVSNDFLAAHADVVKGYIDILDQATKEYREASDEVVSTIAAELGLEDAAAKEVMSQIDVLDKSQQDEYIKQGELISVLRQTSDFLLAQKSITASPSDDVLSGALAKELYN